MTQSSWAKNELLALCSNYGLFPVSFFKLKDFGNITNSVIEVARVDSHNDHLAVELSPDACGKWVLKSFAWPASPTYLLVASIHRRPRDSFPRSEAHLLISTDDMLWLHTDEPVSEDHDIWV